MGKVIPLGIVQEIKLTNSICTNQKLFLLENEVHKILWEFEIQTDHSIPGQSSGIVLIDKKKIICRLVDFAVLVDHRMKLKKKNLEIPRPR